MRTDRYIKTMRDMSIFQNRIVNVSISVFWRVMMRNSETRMTTKTIFRFIRHPVYCEVDVDAVSIAYFPVTCNETNRPGYHVGMPRSGCHDRDATAGSGIGTREINSPLPML
jgi:hypothetical protein